MNNDQEDLIQKEFKDLGKIDFPELFLVGYKLLMQGEIWRIKKTAMKAANIGDLNTDIDASMRAQAWERVALSNLKLDEYDSAFESYEKAGNIAMDCGDSLAAAEYFEKSAINYRDNDWKLKHKLLRKARVSYAVAGVNDRASDLYVQESNEQFRNSKGWVKFCGSLYESVPTSV